MTEFYVPLTMIHSPHGAYEWKAAAGLSLLCIEWPSTEAQMAPQFPHTLKGSTAAYGMWGETKP